MPPLKGDELRVQAQDRGGGPPPGQRVDAIKAVVCLGRRKVRRRVILCAAGKEQRRIQTAETELVNLVSCLDERLGKRIVVYGDPPSEWG